MPFVLGDPVNIARMLNRAWLCPQGQGDGSIAVLPGQGVISRLMEEAGGLGLISAFPLRNRQLGLRQTDGRPVVRLEKRAVN